jgi:hypothetical protein
MNDFVYSHNDSSGHVPSAESLDRSGYSSHAASFPAVTQLFPASIPAANAQLKIIQKQDDTPSGVAQMENEGLVLLYFILGSMTTMPELLAITAFSTGVGVLMTWLRDRHNYKISLEKIAPLCRRLNVDPQQLINQLNQAEGGLNEQELKEFDNLYYDNFHLRQKWDIPEEGLNPLVVRGLVPSVLIDNLTGDDQKKVDSIFKRLNNFPFTYTGAKGQELDGFMRKTGDCHTLSQMFKTATEAAGIQGVEIVVGATPMLVEPLPIHGRGSTKNVEGVSCWYFSHHYWCTFNGQFYDLLFMTKTPPLTSYRTKTLMYKGVSYMVFDNSWYMITDEEAQKKLGMNLNGKMGIVKPNREELHEIIVANRLPVNELEW